MADGPRGSGGQHARQFALTMQKDDIVIDGGNSYYIDDIRRAKELAPRGIHYVDVGTSGGVWGLERGYCQMIGGENDIVETSGPDFQNAGAGTREYRSDSGPGKSGRHRRGGISALRSGRRAATSSRWFTTESNTASWPLTPKA